MQLYVFLLVRMEAYVNKEWRVIAHAIVQMNGKERSVT